MRRVLPIVAPAACPACAAPADAGPALWPAPSQYGATLRWDSRAQTLSGSEQIAYSNRSAKKLSYVYLRVWPNAYGSCGHPWAHVSVTGGGRFDRWNVSCTAMRVKLARSLGPGARRKLGLRIRVKVPRTSNRFGQDAGVVYLG